MISMRHCNTYRVENLTPRVYTSCVESPTMKTIGERIRQAREAHKLSGEALAKKVGYKNQSAIGNLENRVGGTGGSKLGSIADALNVPVEWLMRGPDTENIPFLPGVTYHGPKVNTTAREPGSDKYGSSTSLSAGVVDMRRPLRLSKLLEGLSGYLKQMDTGTRRRAGLLLADLANAPEDYDTVAAAMTAMMDSGNSTQTAEKLPESTSSNGR